MIIASPVTLHVAAGAVAIVAGYAALSLRKGEKLHRAFGTVFVLSMAVMASMGALLAFRIPEWGNFGAGLFTLYLVATAWMTVRRPERSIGGFERVAPFAGGAVAAFLLTIGLRGAAGGSGMVDGAPGQAYAVFGALAALAALLDFSVIRRGGVAGRSRIARHLWRMCLALFIAAGSFFLGQQKVMPEYMRGAPILFVLALAPLALMIFWLAFVAFTKKFKGAPETAPAPATPM